MDIQKCTAVAEDGRVCMMAHKCRRHMGPTGMMQAWGPPGNDFRPESGCENYEKFEVTK